MLTISEDGTDPPTHRDQVAIRLHNSKEHDPNDKRLRTFRKQRIREGAIESGVRPGRLYLLRVRGGDRGPVRQQSRRE